MSARTLAFTALAVILGGALARYAFRQFHEAIDADAGRARTPAVTVPSTPVVDPVANEQDTATSDGAAADGGDPRDRAQAVVPEPVSPSLTELMLPDVQLPPPLLQAQQTFAAEPVDTAWARAAEARILGELAALTGRPLISLVAECRSTVCRLQIVERESPPNDGGASAPNGLPPSLLATANSIRNLVSSVGLEERGAISVPDPSGTRILLAYFRREGASTSDTGLR